MALDYSNGSIIQQGLLDAFNEGGQYYVAYTAAAPMLTVRERGGQLQVLPVAASIPGSTFDMVKTPGQPYTQASGSYTGVSFACKPAGVEVAVDLSLRLPESALIDGARMCRRLVDTANEAILYSAVSAPGVFLTSTASAAWTVPTSDPAADVMAAAAKIREASGAYPNLLAVSAAAWETLLGHPALRDRVAAMRDRGPRAVEESLGALLGVDRVVKSTVVAGDTPAAVWPRDEAFLCVAAQPGDGPGVASALRSVYWEGEGASEDGWVVETYYDERTRSQYVRARANADMVVVSGNLGCLITIPAPPTGGGSGTGGG